MKTERIRKKVVCLPLFAAALLTVTSCNNDTESTPNGDGRVALQVTSGIQTRAHSNTWENVTSTVSDRISGNGEGETGDAEL